jgi:hypothetical protein
MRRFSKYASFLVSVVGSKEAERLRGDMILKIKEMNSGLFLQQSA